MSARPQPRLPRDPAPEVPAVDPRGLAPSPGWPALPRRALTIALSVLPLVALANVALLIWSLEGLDLSQRIAAPGLLALVVPLVFVPMLVNSLRLALWARFLEVGLGFRGALKVITGTMVTMSVTPFATGGVPLKLAFLMAGGVSSRRATTLISFQAAEDALVLFGLLGLGLFFTGFQLVELLGAQPGLSGRLDALLEAAGIGLAAGLSAAALLGTMVLTGRLGMRARRISRTGLSRARDFAWQVVADWLAVWRRGKGLALANLGLAAVQWLVRFSIAGLVLAAFGQAWHPALYWVLQYLVQAISAIVPTPGGVGGAEAAFLLLFAPVAPRAVLLPAMSTWRLLFFYLPLAGAALIFFVLHRRALAAARRGQAQRAAAEAAAPPRAAPQPAE